MGGSWFANPMRINHIHNRLIKDKHPGPGIGDGMVQLSASDTVVYGNKNSPEAGTSDKHLNKLQGVHKHRSDPVALFYPKRLQPGSGSVGTVMQFAVSNDTVIKNDGRFFWMQFPPSLHPECNVHGFDHIVRCVGLSSGLYLKLLPLVIDSSSATPRSS